MSFRLIHPCNTQHLTQHFMRRPDVYKAFGFPGHEGVDFGLPVGDPIYAAAAGRVERKEDMPEGYGLWIMLVHEHEGEVFRTIYGHLSKQLVEVGQLVDAGKLIGEAGNTGNSTGPHLHFTLKLAGATQAGFTGYRSDEGFDGTYPRDIIDPTPWFHPPLKKHDGSIIVPPIQPLHAQHPSLSLGAPTNVQTEAKPVGFEAKVIVDTINVRRAPSTDEPPIAQLMRDMAVTLDTKASGTDLVPWYRILKPDAHANGWIPLSFDGVPFLSYAEADVLKRTLTVVNHGDTANPRSEQPTLGAATGLVASPVEGTETMVVANTGDLKLKVRVTTDMTTPELVKLADGTELVVKRASLSTGNITWRQIVSPEAYAGKWVAEKYTHLVYLLPVDHAEEEKPSAAPGVTASHITSTTTAEAKTETMEVVNTGRTQLNVRKNPDAGEPAETTFPDHTRVVVTTTPKVIGEITWRQIVSPTAYKDYWLAELSGSKRYLQPVMAGAAAEKIDAPDSTGIPTIDMWQYLVPAEGNAHMLSSGELIFCETLSTRSALIRKNKHMEHIYLYTDPTDGREYLMRGFDDSADYKGHKAAYIPTEGGPRGSGGRYGHRWMPRHVHLNQSFGSESYVSFYHRDSGALIESAGPAINYYRVVKLHPEWRGLQNVLQVEWRLGDENRPSPHEVYFLGKGMGYVGWGEGTPRNLIQHQYDIHFVVAYGVFERYTYNWFDPAKAPLQV